MEENSQEPLMDLSVDHDATNSLNETARWTKFISIVGIIGVALLLLCLAFAGTMMTTLTSKMMPGFERYTGLLIALFIIVVAIFGLMVSLLYRFSTNIKKGIEMQDQELFNKALNSLKIYFIISGVFAVLSLLTNFSSLFKL
jgi:hypothetical protein